jgi:hypothetical protein
MTSSIFQPLSVRHGSREPFQLLEGTPPWLTRQLISWLSDQLPDPHGGLLRDWCQAAASQLRWDLTAFPRDRYATYSQVLLGYASIASDRHAPDGNRLLDLVDWAVQQLGTFLNPDNGWDTRRKLALILFQAGSVWMLGPDPDAGLQRRVGPELQDTYSKAVAPGDEAAEALSDAWEAAFGRHPDPQHAWDSCIKAVEALLGPIVLPDTPKRTYGMMCAALRDDPTKWTFVYSGRTEKGQEPKADGSTFLNALNLLPYGPGRHPNGAPPATPAQARAVAEGTAVIVQWLRDGCLKPVSV